MFGMLGVFAEFERAMIQERVRAGLRRAEAQGTKSGRPRTDAAIRAAPLAALRTGGQAGGISDDGRSMPE